MVTVIRTKDMVNHIHEDAKWCKNGEDVIHQFVSRNTRLIGVEALDRYLNGVEEQIAAIDDDDEENVVEILAGV